MRSARPFIDATPSSIPVGVDGHVFIRPKGFPVVVAWVPGTVATTTTSATYSGLDLSKVELAVKLLVQAGGGFMKSLEFHLAVHVEESDLQYHVLDVKLDGEWMNFDSVFAVCETMELPFMQPVYSGVLVPELVENVAQQAPEPVVYIELRGAPGVYEYRKP
jgi:hypothetical protein